MKDHGPDALEGLAGLYNFLQKFKAMVDKDLFMEPRPLERLIADAPDGETRGILFRKVFQGRAIDIIRQFFPDPTKHRIIQASLSASAVDGTYKSPLLQAAGSRWHITTAWATPMTSAPPKVGSGPSRRPW